MRPGTVKIPGPRLPRSFLISPLIASKTPATCLRERSVACAISVKIWLLVRGLVSVVLLLLAIDRILSLMRRAAHWADAARECTAVLYRQQVIQPYKKRDFLHICAIFHGNFAVFGRCAPEQPRRERRSSRSG